jgi:Trk K+ transport system NAD-binding subunit
MRVAVLGDSGALGEALVRQLGELGASGVSVPAASDSELAEVLAGPEWTAAVVLTRDDALALRLTLLCAHTRPDLPLWVTLFDRTTVHQLREIVPEVHVIAPAELVAERLAGECAGSRRPDRRGGGVRIVDDALRLLVATGAGLLATLVLETVLSSLALHESLIDAVYFSARSVAAVADAPRAAAAPVWFKLSSVVLTVAALVLVAIFTAAIVRRLSRPRLTTLFGPRRAVSAHHVVIVGLGQVGFRLAERLIASGQRVIAVERALDAPLVRLAAQAGIPVALGRGDDRAVLELVGVSRCAAIAAVTSEDLVNVAVGLAARDIRANVPVVLRLGDGNVAAETESLLHLGRIVDAHHVTAAALARAVCGAPGESSGPGGAGG